MNRSSVHSVGFQEVVQNDHQDGRRAQEDREGVELRVGDHLWFWNEVDFVAVDEGKREESKTHDVVARGSLGEIDGAK